MNINKIKLVLFLNTVNLVNINGMESDTKTKLKITRNEKINLIKKKKEEETNYIKKNQEKIQKNKMKIHLKLKI